VHSILITNNMLRDKARCEELFHLLFFEADWVNQCNNKLAGYEEDSNDCSTRE